MAERGLKSVPPARGEAPDVHEAPPVVAAPPPADMREWSGSKKTRKFDRRRTMRWGLFGLLPVALIAGAYWYVTGGRIMSTDNAYVNAETVGISTDVAGIVKDVDVTENQHVAAGQVLYRLDPLQFQIALAKAKANLAQTGLNVELDEGGLQAHA